MEFVSGFKRYMLKPDSKVQNLKDQIANLRYQRDMVQHFIVVAKEKGQEFDQDGMIWVNRAEEKIKEEEETVKNLEAQAKKRCFLGLCPNLKSLNLLNKKAEEDAQAVLELIQQAKSHKFNNESKVQNLEDQPEGDKRNMEVEPEKQTSDKAKTVMEVEAKVSGSAKADTTKAMSKRIEQRRSDRGLYPGDTQETKSRPIQGFEAFESRKATLENIVEALKDPDLKIIGINGRPGVGKTMLVKEAARRAREENRFDEVVMVTVSWNPNIKRIQREIADALGLKLDEETVFARAMRLQQWLKKQDKRVLLILDDIWDGQRLELEQVGIAIEGDQSIASEEDLGRPLMQNISENGFQKFSAVRFKILLTSTSRQVLIDMKTEEIFDVHVLTDEEAMGWIQKVVGNAANQPGYRQLLTQVVKNCAGFPVAISAIAIALRTQNFNHLVEALRKETKPIAKKEEALKSVYFTIEWSYSMLENPQLQSFFQLCALLPRGSDIHVSDLLRYNSGLRIASNVSTLEEAKKCLNKLKDAGLLLSSDNNEVVKMHDIVRDVAIWIASEEKRMFVIEDENRIEELLKERKLNSCAAISLPYSSNNKLPDNLECPRLKLLVLFNKNPSLEVPDNFFKRMSELLILDFTGMDFASLPSSFTSLRNLQRLRFDECKLNDIAIVAKLKQLDTLKILSSDIQRLPQEIGGLTRLKSLDLSNCSKLKVIPDKIISGLPYLEELLMRNSFDQWGVEGNASFSELKSLSGLIALDVHIHSVQLMPAELFSEKLNRYKILIGEVWDWSRKYEKERTLKLQLTKGIHLDRGIKLLLQKTEDLYLDEMQGIKNLLYELDGTGFPQLENLYIQNGPELLFIINSMEVASRKAFPILKSLVLQNLINLEKICQGKLEEECFNRLQIISVERCDRLRNLFPFSMTKMLVQLQEIKVSKCKSIEEIVTEEREQNAGIATNKTEFGQLRSLTLKLLPELRSFCSKEKSRSIYQLEPVNTWSWLLFDGKVVFPVLEKLQLSCINIERLWLKSSYYSQNLTSLAIEGCGNLKHLFSPSITRCLLRLKSFEIIDCKCIREIIVPDEVKEKEKETETKEKVKEEEKEEIDKILFPQLNSVKMINLVNLVGFCSESCFLEFPSLKLLEIENCPRLKEFMHKPQSTDITTVIGTLEINKENDHHLGEQALFNAKVAFPKLEKLKISRLGTVKIWHGQLHTDSFSKLKEMKVGYCNDILTIFPSIKEWNFQGLETLIVFNCNSLQHIFESSDIKVGTQLRRLYISHLPKLEHVCNEDSQSNLTFENIRNVYIQDCWCLKSLFPASVAKGLKQLVDLTIDSCGLEVVISEGKVQNQDVNEFEFPEVCSLTLQNLPELKCFYPAEYEAKWPKLKKLKTYHCGQEVLGMEEHQSSNQKPLFFFEKVIHDLEELSLNSKHISVIRNHPFQVGIFSRIKVLQVLGYHDKPVVFLFNLLEKFNNLKKLELIHCDFKGNFIDEGDESEKKTERETVSLLNTGYIGEQNSQLPHVVLNLEALEFRRCDGSISLGLYLSSFQNLITLDLWQCKATALITSSVARNLVQLIKMRIRDCIMVREIVAKEKDDAKDLVSFSKLKFLVLHYLPNLSSFCSDEYSFQFPSLEQVIVRQCPKLKIFCQGVLSTPQLHRVRLSEKDYKGFWAGELNATISQLHKNTVRYYEQEHLKLHEFPELEEIWNTVPRGIIDFKRLKCLEVYVCNNLRYMLTVSMAADLVQMQQIKVKNCKVIEEIIRDDKSTTMKIIFPQLKTITIKSCLGLSWFSSGSFALECPNLKEITLVGCPKMVAFASTVSNELHNEIIGGEYLNILVKDASNVSAKPLFSNKVSLPLLKDLTIVDMGNLERIWDDQLEMNSFSKLKHLEVHSCVKLSNIFPLNMLERLQRLKNLQVMECASLEELFEHKFNEAEINTKFVFPQMTYLNLSMLPKLKSFYSGVHTTEWPLLKKLDVYGCDKVEIFASEYSSFHETRGQHPLFWINMGTFPCLEELRLESNGNMKEIWHGQLPEGYFKLKVLELINSPPLTVLPPYFFRSLSNLQNFVLSDASINEIFPYEEPGGDEKLEGARAQLSVLRLSKLDELTHFWKENFKPGAIFCNMRVLEVQDCGKLDVLVPSSVSFENLTTLEVSRCEGLKHLFAHSTAKSLVQLSRMSVTDCKMLEEIVTCPGDEVKEAIVFTQLKYLGLSCLPNIESFCSGNCTFKFPSLETVTMRHCPKMKTSPRERFIAPKLKRVYSREAGGEGHWEGDQNTTIQLLFMETVEYRGIEYVVLSDSSKLMEIRNWNPQGILDFKNLKFLKVHNCRNLRCPFNPSMAMDLVHLEKLEIHDCEMLEEVIIRKGLPKRERMSKKMFPKLVTLLLISLPNLTRFYSGNYLEFPFLKELWIQSCPMLNTFISGSVTRNNSRQNIHTDLTVLIDEKVAFPSLEKLGIMDMGSLRKIYNDQISMDSFSKLKVLKLIGLSKQLDILPSGFFLSLSKLERLVVDDASFTEIFQCKSTEKKMQAWELDSFSDLRLSKLPELLHLWKEEFECQPGTHFRNLRSLKVLECSKLKNLVPSTASFQNLTTLEISRCHGLRNLVTPSTAKSMVQLKRMRITDCKMLEGIVADADDRSIYSIMFKHLEYLRLQSLQALTSFCSGNYRFEFPSLVELVAIECPKFSVFCKGKVSTPLLKRVRPTEGGDRSFTDKDLNSTINVLYSEKAQNDVKELEFLQWTMSDLWRPSAE
ncbi:hypothetical protein ERO13_D11G270000v2 [Gossypium hirsutum]|uniref:Uncharacterized protein isoform X1 n=2 Tax=Gossypium TaxID=3633 RepID=A0A1U8M469_GOSHI|nr:uncharacterized protein LOC107933821 isoform X1 [Gossypium hirsutum]KAG4122484.1 hypothetical protein ERO13_D11G270000v2 [Gossypium hirsutum]